MTEKTVFISYSHDSTEHSERVRGLSASLSRDGCQCQVDVYKNTGEDWPTWMTRQLLEANFILCAVTETYAHRFRDSELPDVGRGVGWEAGLIRRLLYQKKLHNDRVFPVLFERSDEQYIPLELQGYDFFTLDGQAGYETLLRKVLNRPLYVEPAIGTPPELESKTTRPLFERPTRSADGGTAQMGQTASTPTRFSPRRRAPIDFEDGLVSQVAIALKEAEPLALRTLLLHVNELFNRSTFRFEPLRECVSHEWGSRLHAAMQTLELLRRYSSVFSDLAPDNDGFTKLMDEVNGYCLAMATCLFERPVAVSEMRNFVGSDHEFLGKLPPSIHFEQIPDDINQKVDGPRDRAVEQIDKLRKEFLQRNKPVEGKALVTWREKLAFLMEQEAISVDPAQRFALKQQIEEAKAKIRELEG